MSDSEQSSQLEAARIDRAVAVAKGVIGALPILGPMFAEIIGSVIPQQRLDRIADVLKRLEERLGEIEQQRLQSSLATDSEAVDLLEEGMVQATRAVSDERRDQIAILLHTTLTDEQLRHAEKRKLWSLLGSLSDVEVLITNVLHNPPLPPPNEFAVHLRPSPAGIESSANRNIEFPVRTNQ